MFDWMTKKADEQQIAELEKELENKAKITVQRANNFPTLFNWTQAAALAKLAGLDEVAEQCLAKAAKLAGDE
jgi:hypothetical protein